MVCLIRLAALLVCFMAGPSAAQLPFLPIQTQAAAPPGGITFVVGTIKAGAASPIVTDAIDTAGCTPGCLIVINITGFSLGSPAVITDSKSNTYTSTAHAGAGTNSQIWYMYLPTVGSGHTFSFAAGSFGTIAVAAFKGTTGSVVDTVHAEASGAGGSTIQPGSITPSANDSLVVTGVSFEDASSATYSINSGFTITDFLFCVAGVNEGGGLAYLVQTTAAAVNPTWTTSATSTAKASTIRAFQ